MPTPIGPRGGDTFIPIVRRLLRERFAPDRDGLGRPQLRRPRHGLRGGDALIVTVTGGDHDRSSKQLKRVKASHRSERHRGGVTGRLLVRGLFDHSATDQEHLARSDPKPPADILPRDSDRRAESEK